MRAIASLFFVVVALQPMAAQSDAHEQTQMQRLVKEHDQLMADEMGKTVRLIGQLQERAKENSGLDKYQHAIKALKEANKAMADWMQGFGSRFDAEEMYQAKPLTDQKKVWLNQEEVKFFAMKDQLESSIERAELLLLP